jgi:phosphonate transport system substrate-binding protein
MLTPKEGFVYYQQLLNYIAEILERPVKLVDRESYTEVNNLIKSGYIDAAFVCGRPYIDGRDEFGLELLVAPQVYGKARYHSYIIVSKDSSIENFKELRGKSFAFADPLSNTGKLFPTYMLAKIGETPDSFFHKHIYTYAHDKSIKAVAQGIVDGAAVDHLIWEYLNRTNPEFTSKTRVIEKSPPYGIPPVVVRPGLDPELKEKLRKIFLNAHKDEKGRKILKGMMIDKFVLIDESAYESIEEMTSRSTRQNAEKPAKE